MKMRRNVFVMLCAVCLAGRTFALTNGPSQPEFASFEPVDATDIVNLPTGDFAYTLPLGNVKTPDGIGYPLVLSYHAGILNEQEATWVGLGWTLNVGAINRQVRALPDDYGAYSVLSCMNDPGERGWNLDVGVGFGGVSATVGFYGKAGGGVYFEGVTSISGSFGIKGIEFAGTMGQNGYSVGVGASYYGASVMIGYHSSWDGKNQYGFVSTGLSNVASFSMTTKGKINVSVVGVNQPQSFSMSKDGLHQSAKAFSFSLPLGYKVDLGFKKWGWYYYLEKNECSNGYLFQTKYLKSSILCDNELLNDCMTPNFSKFTYSKDPGGGELMFHPEETESVPEKVEASEIGEYTFPSQDAYSMSSQGISGIFMPFINEANKYYYSSDPVRDGLMGECCCIHSEDGNIGTVCPPGTDLFHRSEVTLGDNIDFKAIDEMSGNNIDDVNEKMTYPGDNQYQNIGKFGKKIIPLFGLDDMSILSGFAVTDQQGKTYYYTCPLYSYYQTTYINQNPWEPKLLDNGKYEGKCSYRRMVHPFATAWLLTAVTGPDYIKMAAMPNEVPEEKLMPHDGDLGYWVRFNYAYGPKVVDYGGVPKLKDVTSCDANDPEIDIDKALYGWRMPYWDNETATPHPHLKDKKTDKFASMYGAKDVTYLKSIETASEVAFLRTSERLDGYGFDSASFYKLGNNETQYKETKDVQNFIKDLSNEGRVIRCAPTVAEVGKDGTVGTRDKFDLSKCLVITANGAEFSIENFENAKQGEELFKLHVDYQIRYVKYNNGLKNFWGGYGPHTHETWRKKSLCLIKDTAGCEYDENGVPTKINDIDRMGENRTISGCPDYNSRGPFGTRPVAKCFYAKRNSLGQTVFYVLAYNGYSLKNDLSDPVYYDYKTGVCDAQSEKHDWKWNGTIWRFDKIKEINDATIFYSVENKPTFMHLEKYCRYVKKLDEIAWYSKAQYPYVNGFFDPQEPLVKNNPQWRDNLLYPFPKSYRRVKFRYNYELAKGTPNSKSDGAPVTVNGKQVFNGGRLTLKEVYEQGGTEDEPVNMPSYLFQYQGTEQKYVNFEDIDPWGFKKTRKDGDQTITFPASTSVGVNWNLSKITLPSCGSISIDYERDVAKSSWLTAERLNREYDIKKDGEKKLELDPLKGGLPTYTHALPITNTLNSPVITTPLSPSGQPDYINEFEPGMLVICKYKGLKNAKTYVHNGYLYRIAAIDFSTRTLTLDKPINPPSDWQQITTTELIGIKKSEGICDGLRVRSVSATSLSGITKTNYSYKFPGVIETVPEEAIPTLFSDDKKITFQPGSDNICANFIFDGKEGTDYIFRSGRHWPYTTGIAANYTFSAQYKTYGNINGIFDGIQVENSYKNCGKSTPIPGGDQLELKLIRPYQNTEFDLYILYNFDAPIGTVPPRGRVEVFKESDPGNNIIDEQVSYISTVNEKNQRCTIGAAKVNTIPLRMDYNEIISVRITFPDPTQSGDYIRVAGVEMIKPEYEVWSRKYEPIYTTGNTTVIYPVVDAFKTLPNWNLFAGGTRYSYYTFDDTVMVNSTQQTMLGSTFDTVTPTATLPPAYQPYKIWKIVDRTGIIGLAKSIKQIRVDEDNNNHVVSETQKQYAFSDELSRNGIGVQTDPNTRLDTTKPLGLLRERCGRLVLTNSIYNYEIKTVTDVVKAKPFLVSITNKTDNAPNKTSFGLFDAQTGDAMATLVTTNKPDGSKKARLDVNIPFNYYVNLHPERLNYYWAIRLRNLYTLPGGTFVSNNNNNLEIPNKITDIPFDHYDSDGKNACILSANFNDYSCFQYSWNPNQDGSIYQWRLTLNSTNAWQDQPGKMIPFSWRYDPAEQDPYARPPVSQANWIPNSTIESIDMYSRPLTEINAAGEVSSAVHHPITSAVIAAINNAKYQECGVYTCDYEDYTMNSTGDAKVQFDKLNGWKLGDIYTGGELKLVSLDKTLQHFGLKSLHVKNSRGPVKEKITLKPGSNYLFSAWVFPLNTNPIRFFCKTYANAGSPTVIDRTKTLTANKWQLVDFKINQSELMSYADIAFGNNNTGDKETNFYIEDIRFHPADALVSTFYYDYNLVVPTTYVDANNKAKYFKYDAFGRVIEKGVIKEEK